MKRIVLTDGTGRWIDIEGAERYEEATWYNGYYIVSCATNRLYIHEELYKKNDLWIKHRWDTSMLQPDTWEVISKKDAAIWLSINNYEEPPEELRDEYEKLRLT